MGMSLFICSLTKFASTNIMAVDFYEPLKRFEVSKVNGYMMVQEAAKKWGITPRQVQILCKEGRIAGATRMSRLWIIPEDAEKPTVSKRKVRDIDE